MRVLGGTGDREPAFFGIDVPQADVAHVDRLGEQLGCRPEVMNRFVKLDGAFGLEQLRGLGASGRTPMVSLEPWSWRSRRGDADEASYSLASLVRGDHDAALRSIATVLAAYHHPVLLRFAHEMNADWYPWGVVANGNTPSEYVAAWRHVHDLMSSIAPAVQWVWSPVATWWPKALPLRSVYPGDAYVDLVAASGYGGAHGRTAEQTFGAWHREVRIFTDRPAMLSETGASGADKTGWIASLPAFLDEHPDVRGFVWFDTSPATTGATGDYRIDDRPEHLHAFRAALGAMRTTCAPTTTPTVNPGDEA
jgi:hypothetical protein